MTENPFFEGWTTPFGMPPFDRIRPEHFPPAFDRGMQEQIAEIAAIAGPGAAPSFADTIEALERGGRLLERVSRVFFNLTASNTDDTLEAIARDYAPRLARHHMRIALDPDLFARIADLHRRRASLGQDTDQLRLIERYYLRFVRNGALLKAEQKQRMAAISERLASLHTLFGQHVLHDERDWQLVLDETDLDGLPEFARAAAAQAGEERGISGRYALTLSRSAVESFLTFSSRRDLRRTVWEAWSARGAHNGASDNAPIIGEILALRAEQGRLLGYENFADYRLDDTMAKTSAAAERLLLQVWEPAKAKARDERAELEAMARAEGLNEAIEPWDWRYYAEKVRQTRYDLDEAETKPYFELDNMVQAAFDTAGRLFGLTFAERDDLPTYHPDVRVWEVRDEAGSHVGIFLHDNFARPGKRSGAWSSRYRDQENTDEPVAPIVVNNNNFARGDLAAGEPTLLSFDDAKTLFHEFGHGLHIVEPGALPLAIRHCGPTRFRRVSVADLRALDVGAADIADLRPPLPDWRADTRGSAAPASRCPELQPGLRHSGVCGLGADGPRSAPCCGDRAPRPGPLRAGLPGPYGGTGGDRAAPPSAALPDISSRGVAMPPAIMRISGLKCWTPTVSLPLPRRPTPSIPSSLRASNRFTAPATRAIRWSFIARSADASRQSMRCCGSAAWQRRNRVEGPAVAVNARDPAKPPRIVGALRLCLSGDHAVLNFLIGRLGDDFLRDRAGSCRCRGRPG